MKNDNDDGTYDETIPMSEGVYRDIEYLQKCIDRFDDEQYVTESSLKNFDWEEDQE